LGVNCEGPVYFVFLTASLGVVLMHLIISDCFGGGGVVKAQGKIMQDETERLVPVRQAGAA
jgi:hypothetical protein